MAGPRLVTEIAAAALAIRAAAGSAPPAASQLDLLDRAVTSQRAGLLTYAADAAAAPVQLMGLYQTKGREADATVVVVRSIDFYGREQAPFPVGSRLLYVVLTRARHKTILLSFGHEPPPLVARSPSWPMRDQHASRGGPAV